jgi:hypothetical protein
MLSRLACRADIAGVDASCADIAATPRSLPGASVRDPGESGVV